MGAMLFGYEHFFKKCHLLCSAEKSQYRFGIKLFYLLVFVIFSSTLLLIAHLWLYFGVQCNPPLEVRDLFRDIQDGKLLMALLEELSGCKLVRITNLLQNFNKSL